MEIVHVSGGYNFRLSNSPRSEVLPLFRPKYLGVSSVGVRDFKAKMKVKIGDFVQQGQELFYDKTYSKIRFVSPSSGRVFDIKYGKRRSLQSVVIRSSFNKKSIFFGIKGLVNKFSKSKIRSILLESGLWISLKSFPGYSILPEEQEIKSFYLSMFTSEPYFPNKDIILCGNEKYFKMGVFILKKLSSVS